MLFVFIFGLVGAEPVQGFLCSGIASRSESLLFPFGGWVGRRVSECVVVFTVWVLGGGCIKLNSFDNRVGSEELRKCLLDVPSLASALSGAGVSPRNGQRGA